MFISSEQSTLPLALTLDINRTLAFTQRSHAGVHSRTHARTHKVLAQVGLYVAQKFPYIPSIIDNGHDL